MYRRPFGVALGQCSIRASDLGSGSGSGMVGGAARPLLLNVATRSDLSRDPHATSRMYTKTSQRRRCVTQSHGAHAPGGRAGRVVVWRRIVWQPWLRATGYMWGGGGSHGACARYFDALPAETSPPKTVARPPTDLRARRAVSVRARRPSITEALSWALRRATGRPPQPRAVGSSAQLAQVLAREACYHCASEWGLHSGARLVLQQASSVLQLLAAHRVRCAEFRTTLRAILDAQGPRLDEHLCGRRSALRGVRLCHRSGLRMWVLSNSGAETFQRGVNPRRICLI